MAEVDVDVRRSSGGGRSNNMSLDYYCTVVHRVDNTCVIHRLREYKQAGGLLLVQKKTDLKRQTFVQTTFACRDSGGMIKAK